MTQTIRKQESIATFWTQTTPVDPPALPVTTGTDPVYCWRWIGTKHQHVRRLVEHPHMPDVKVCSCYGMDEPDDL